MLYIGENIGTKNGPKLDISFCYHEQMRDDPRIIALKDYLQNLIREDLSKFSNTL